MRERIVRNVFSGAGELCRTREPGCRRPTGRRDRKRDEETIRCLFRLCSVTPEEDRDRAEQMFFFLATGAGISQRGMRSCAGDPGTWHGRVNGLQKLPDRYGLVRWAEKGGYRISNLEFPADEVRRPMRQIANPEYRTRCPETEAYMD